VAIWTIALDAGRKFQLPRAQAGSTRALYFFDGKDVQIDGETFDVEHVVLLRADCEVDVHMGSAAGQLLLLQGKPIGEPTVQHGPFVMNTRAEIQKAIRDYQTTHYGGWPWPSEAPNHGPQNRRFVQRPNLAREDAPPEQSEFVAL
jgi:redox-sensitive bicupin YhaK (pirin superfamily)